MEEQKNLVAGTEEGALEALKKAIKEIRDGMNRKQRRAYKQAQSKSKSGKDHHVQVVEVMTKVKMPFYDPIAQTPYTEVLIPSGRTKKIVHRPKN